MKSLVILKLLIICTGPKEFYSLLCDALPEDKQLRMKLQKEKLASISQSTEISVTLCVVKVAQNV